MCDRINLIFVITLVGAFLLSGCGLRWRFRMAAAETSLRKIEEAERNHKDKTGKYGTLQELSAAGYLSGNLSKGFGDAYCYEIKVKDHSYEAHALPDKSVDDLLPAFLIDQSGTMHVSPIEAREATIRDPIPSEK